MGVLLSVNDLKTYFYQDGREFRAVDGVSFEIKEGEVLGIVGESGCGKSVTATSIMGLIEGKGRIVSGEILLDGKNLRELDEESLRRMRGKDMAMIFQDPMTSLNPVYTVGHQIVEALCSHSKIAKHEAQAIAVEMLKKVGIPSPERRVKEYPHQLSGGMRQRVMIAMALCMNPKLLIADEPTTALDVTIQSQILDLILDLRKQFGTAVMLITHDLGVIAEVCDRVVVMYAGKVVESASVNDIFSDPRHPYTQGLMKALPRFNEDVETLYTIPGIVPSADSFSTGCRFADRCPKSTPQCREQDVELRDVSPGHTSACLFD